jgi:hypothetical protein
LAILSTQTSVSAAAYSIDYLPEALLEKSRKWVERPGGAFSSFAAVGIKAWTYPPGLAVNNPAAAKQLEAEATQRLLTAVSFASPLVEIDELLVQQIHGSAASGLKYEFSDIPFDAQDSIITTLQAAWTGQATQTLNSGALRGSLNPIADQTEIVIFSTFSAPYAVPVFKSLTDPIRRQWITAKSAAAGPNSDPKNDFWTMRRSRPLRNFVPMQQGAFQAFVTGWVAGRMSGHIRFEENPYLSKGYKTVKVFSDKDKRWVAFPSDPDLLGVDGLGMASGSPALDQAGWNIPAALLESFGLAIANVAGMDLSPLDPYWAVVDIGLSLKHVGAHTANTPLENFLKGNAQPHGKVSELVALSGSLDQDERSAKAKKYLEDVDKFAEAKISQSASTPAELETFSRSFEIAPELRTAASSILLELEFLATARPDDGLSALVATEEEPEA